MDESRRRSGKRRTADTKSRKRHRRDESPSGSESSSTSDSNESTESSDNAEDDAGATHEPPQRQWDHDVAKSKGKSRSKPKGKSKGKAGKKTHKSKTTVQNDIEGLLASTAAQSSTSGVIGHDHAQTTNNGGLGSNGAAPMDAGQLAQAMAMIQAQQQAANLFHSLSPMPFSHNPLNYLGMGSTSMPQQSPTLQPHSHPPSSAFCDGDLTRKVENMLAPFRNEIIALKSRTEALEAERFTSRSEIASFKHILRALAGKLKSNNDVLEIESLESQLGLPSLNQGYRHATKHPTTLHPPADIPVQIELVTTDSSRNDAMFVSDPQEWANSVPRPLHSIPSASRSQSPDPTVPIETISSAKCIAQTNVPKTGLKNRGRKPELSRVVRATMFKLMGITTTTVGSDNGKFSDRRVAFHGYGPQPPLPDFTPEVLTDPETGCRLWRWDWSKTVRQSNANADFASEIRKTIVDATNHFTESKYPEVPQGDWDYLDDSIESAYVNLRRERESQTDPDKAAKKETHRARNKKRGLKEEKARRRKKALEDLRSGTGIAKLLEQGKQVPIESPSESWADALEITHMSSEEEADAQQAAQGTAVPGYNPVPGSAPTKVFSVFRPAWRSDEAQELYAALDTVKVADRAYKRVIGAPRMCDPPPDTPSWMVRPGYTIAQRQLRT